MALSEKDKKEIKEIIGREPSAVELIIFDTMWSEHCSYKSSKKLLKKYLPTHGSEVLLGIGEDSGIIKWTEFEGKTYGIVLSHESHNHPSQILPIEGAATGVGGVVRDVYCMGADVLGVLNSLHFGVNNDGKSPIVEEIAEKVVEGVSDYANPLGVPVLGGETLYHPSYNDNCLVNVAAVGLVDADDIIHSYVPKEAKDEAYDVILIGKSTDATGFGGASFSSGTLDSEDSTTNIGAVQVHDPFLKRVLVEAIKALFVHLKEHNISAGFKDLGAGGIACAASELAVGGGFGVDVNLDLVNVAIEDLPSEVVSCSETQERFCLVVPKKNSESILDIFNKQFALPSIYPNAGAVVIGSINNGDRFKLIRNNEVVCDLPVSCITTEVEAERWGEERDVSTEPDNLPESTDEKLKEWVLSLISDQNSQSKRYVYRHFDNAVRGNTVVYPGEGDAVVIQPLENCTVGLCASMDSNLYGTHDPYVAGAAAVAESVRNVISSGGRPIAVTDCLNYGNPEKPSVYHDFEEGIKGIADACHGLSFIDDESLPIVSGNVSLYNESKNGNAVIPSPVIACVGRLDDYRLAQTMQVREAGYQLICVGKRYSEFAGTIFYSISGIEAKTAPQVRVDEEAKQNKLVYELIQNRSVVAVHDISSGGLLSCLVEMIQGERGLARVGLKIQTIDPVTDLFSENGGYVLAVSTEKASEVLEKFRNENVDARSVAVTTEDRKIVIQSGDKVRVSLSMESVQSAWNAENILQNT